MFCNRKFSTITINFFWEVEVLLAVDFLVFWFLTGFFDDFECSLRTATLSELQS